MKQSIVRCIACIILAAIALPLRGADTKDVRIEWEAVKGAQGYIVEMKDRLGREFYKKMITPSHVVIRLGPGIYRIRITALNLFLKPGSNSGWTDITVLKKQARETETEGDSLTQIGKLGKDQPEQKEIIEIKKDETLKKEEPQKKEEARIKEETHKKEEAQKPEEARKREDAQNREEAQKREEARKREDTLIKAEQARRRAEGYPRGLAGLGPLDIAAGGSCHFVLTRWKNYLKYAPAGHVSLSYRLSGIDAIRNIPVLSSFGFILKSGVIPFSGHTRDKSRMNLLGISPGGGIFYDFLLGTVKKWTFDMRLACIVGASFSRLNIRGLFPENKLIIKLFYDPMVSFKIAFDGYFFTEVGCGFQSVLFSGQPLSSIYPFLQLGIRL